MMVLLWVFITYITRFDSTILHLIESINDTTFDIIDKIISPFHKKKIHVNYDLYWNLIKSYNSETSYLKDKEIYELYDDYLYYKGEHERLKFMNSVYWGVCISLCIYIIFYN